MNTLTTPEQILKIIRLKLDASNNLLTSMLDSWEAIFLDDPSRYSPEDMDLYISSCKFLGKPGIVDKVEEHLNKMPV